MAKTVGSFCREAGYDSLFAAIWKQAVIEDTNKVKKMLDEDLKSAYMPKRVRRSWIKKREERIRNLVAVAVYEESKQWPKNKHNYSQLVEIKNRILKEG